MRFIGIMPIRKREIVLLFLMAAFAVSTMPEGPAPNANMTVVEK